jgi:hypothetical protein
MKQHGIKKQAKIITFLVGIGEPIIYVTKLNSLLKLHFSNRLHVKKIILKKCIFIQYQEQLLVNAKRNSSEKCIFRRYHNYLPNIKNKKQNAL